MKVTGIIAEYNPFHKGHKYQIDTLRKKYQPDYVVVAMSGDFVQRGTPALMDKYARAHMALTQGADLVFELPSYFATASAETFAKGGILLFSTTGVVNSICFGAETDELRQLQEVATILHKEPDWYRNALLSYMKEGMSFPAARAKALPQYADLLESPNNILAIEYLKSLQAQKLSIDPILIPRTGSGYHSTDLSAPNASASAIRNHLLKESDIHAKALPETSYNIMKEYQQEKAFLTENDFSLLLHHALLQESSDSLSKYADMTPALANRLLQQRNNFLSWDDFCQQCNTKEITYSRISRVLTHLLLGIRQDMLLPYLSDTTATLPYLRILGFRKDATPLLTALKTTAKAPLITSPASAEKALTNQGLTMLHTDIFASDLYRSILTNKCHCIFPNEYQRKFLSI